MLCLLIIILSLIHGTYYTVVFNSKYNYKPWETWLDRIQNYLRRSPWYMLVYDHNNTTYLLILHFSNALIWLSQSKFPGGRVLLFSFLGKWITYVFSTMTFWRKKRIFAFKITANCLVFYSFSTSFRNRVFILFNRSLCRGLFLETSIFSDVDY